MSALTGVTTPQPTPAAPSTGHATTLAGGSRALPRWYEDRWGWIAAAVYLGVVLFYEHYVVTHFGSVCECQNSDALQWMWSWRWFVYAFGHGQNPLFTHLIWDGTSFNLASITLAPLTAVAGVPLQALFGSVAAYNVLAFAAPVINGWAAYRLCRYVSGAPRASILAGYTYAFSAYELGHLLGHLNLLFAFVPPMLALLVLRHLNGELPRRRTFLSATVLLVIQFGTSTEMLFDLSCMVLVLLVLGFSFAAGQRRKLIEVALILGVAYVAMAALWSYYLYWSLKGPTESGGAAPGYPADLLSVFVPTRTFRVGGNTFAVLSGSFNTPDPYEQDNYLGFPLIGILLAYSIAGWRLRGTRIVALATLTAFILALGVTLTVGGHQSLHLPYDWLLKLPFFNETTPSRYGLFVSLGAALAMAMWISWARGRGGRVWRWIVGLGAAVILFPAPALPGWIRAPAQPAFFTTNLYRKYLTRNEMVMTIPYSQSGDEMLWQADTRMYFRLAGGYLGYPPPQEASIPIIHYQLYFGAPTPPTDGVSELRSLIFSHRVKVVLIQQTAAQNWPELLIRSGFRLKAVAGGMEVFTPPGGSGQALR